MEPQTINSKNISTPSKLLKYMSLIALGWGIVGLLGLMPGSGFLISLQGPYWFLGVAIIVIFLILALINAIRCFSSGDKVKGMQFIALIIALPLIGVGIGCGTCYVGLVAMPGIFNF